jgi:hypothetical protein
MTFLQPWMLALLPLVGLPLLIHLINQRRFQTVPWAAMRFLLSARALSRGYSRLRHWLVMVLRMLAVAAVIVAVGRPLSRGWLALAAGGRPDTALVILDRSPSMGARGTAAPDTKLATGRRQLAAALDTLGASRTYLLADPDQPPAELADPAALERLPQAGATAAATDIPRLLEAAHTFIRESGSGTTEIWICSDQRANDWAVDAPAWSDIRASFARLPQPVRFQLVAFDDPAPGNVAVRVREAVLEQRGEARQLALTVSLARAEEGPASTVPVTIEIGGVSSVVDVVLAGREAVLANHVIPLAAGGAARGWGRVSIPADVNAADNAFTFAFAAPPARHTIVVAEDAGIARTLALAAEIPPEAGLESTATVVAPGDLATAGLERAALVIWQGALPAGRNRDLLEAHVARGGQLLLLPPARPEETADRAFAGVAWTTWTDHEPAAAPTTWRTDRDLLANTRSGAALPVGDLRIRRTCGLAGPTVPLAALAEGVPLVARAATVDGTPGAAAASAGPVSGVAFLCTSPVAADATLATEGVVLYCLLQRAIDRGLAPLSAVRSLDAGADAAAVLAAGSDARRLSPPTPGAAPEPGWTAGVFASGDRLVAVNRSPAEDAAPILADDRIDEAFAGLSLTRIEGTAGGTGRLVQEIWRGCLVALMLALIGEGLLCLPTRTRSPSATGAARSFEVAA